MNGVLSVLTDVSTPPLMQDPAALVGYPFYYGAFSHLGVLLWASAAAICFFGWRVGPLAMLHLILMLAILQIYLHIE